MKQHTLMPCFWICAITPSLFADSSNQADSTTGEAAHQPPYSITPPALPAVKRSADPYLTTEYLYWKAQEGGLEYAATGISNSQLTPLQKKGSVHRPNFSYDSGFKAGFGLKFRHDNWDVYSNYTHYRLPSSRTIDKAIDTAARKAGGPNAELDVALWFLPTNQSSPSLSPSIYSKITWSLDFNVLDLELGRNYYISSRLTLRPHFGFKLAWIDQNMFLKYVERLGNTQRRHYDQDMFGFGIRAGLNTAWQMWTSKGALSQAFSLYGNFAASAIYCDFDVDQKTSYQTPTRKNTIAHFSNDSQEVNPVLEWSLGLRYQVDFYDENYEFLVQAGWEEQVWLDQNQFSNLYDRTSGNLSLQGLVAKVGFSF